MKLEYRKPGTADHVLGAGEYSIDHESGNTMCTGLWLDGKVVGLLVATDEDMLNDSIMDNGDEICGRFNAFPTLVAALAKAERALSHSVNAVSSDEQNEAIAAVREALTVADRS